ncbi:MAG: hypothetical protein DSM107014_02135 [Gomphosphaeria aponina SAG 52.96 = DSM 107014]|uniref:Uncharacterized protein n=1 Tax=Gomphosphaeria aponina SAG 52.96 = DSM 107014 TaxID=1521640 RepID=A0A941GRI9_9CHRO|nr:hypothetical protein [Gomphosphaeria aponina SAG 52.96 = DSM 107014]
MRCPYLKVGRREKGVGRREKGVGRREWPEGLGWVSGVCNYIIHKSIQQRHEELILLGFVSQPNLQEWRCLRRAFAYALC